MLNLDLLTGSLLILMAAALAAVFVFSSHKAPQWPNVPEYVRYGVGVVSLLFLFRGANLFSLSSSPDALGKTNAMAAVTTIALSYLVISVSFWFATLIMMNKGWDRLAWVRSMLQRQPNVRPIMVDPTEVGHAAGLQVTAPNEGADAVVREMRRA